MQFTLATGTGLVIDVDDDLDPRQVCRQRSTIGATLACPRRAAFGSAVVLPGFAARSDLLDVFEAQQHLLFGQRLRPAAKSMALQLLDDLAQPLALVPLGQ